MSKELSPQVFLSGDEQVVSKILRRLLWYSMGKLPNEFDKKNMCIFEKKMKFQTYLTTFGKDFFMNKCRP